MTYNKWEAGKEVGSQLPTCDEDFCRRLDTIARSIGDREQAAKTAGVSVGQLIKYIKGKSTPTFPIMANLVGETGYTLDWLAYGKESHQSPVTVADKPVTPFNEELFQGAIEALEYWLNSQSKILDPESKSKACLFLYQMAIKVPGLQEDGGYDEEMLSNYMKSL